MTSRLSGPTLVAVASAILFALPQCGCNETRVDSAWLDHPITIDGRKDDWPGQSISDFEKQDFRFGVANDSVSLYLLFTTPDERLAFQALAQGLRTRFRPDGGPGILWIGSPRAFALARNARAWRGDDIQGFRGGRPFAGPGDMTGRIRQALDDLPEEVQIFASSGEDSLILSASEAARRGVEVKVGRDDDGRFIIEMKVPLRKDADHPHAIGVPADSRESSKEDSRAVVVIELRIPGPDADDPASRGDRRGGAGLIRGGLRQVSTTRRPSGDLFPEGNRGRRSGAMTEGLDMTIRVRLSRDPHPRTPALPPEGASP